MKTRFVYNVLDRLFLFQVSSFLSVLKIRILNLILITEVYFHTFSSSICTIAGSAISGCKMFDLKGRAATSTQRNLPTCEFPVCIEIACGAIALCPSARECSSVPAYAHTGCSPSPLRTLISHT